MADSSVGIHCVAPAGLFVCFHSYLNNNLRYELSHLVGVAVHAPSIPLVIVSSALPFPSQLDLNGTTPTPYLQDPPQ